MDEIAAETLTSQHILSWKAVVGEAPVWDDARSCFWCADNAAGAFLQVLPDGNEWRAGRTYSHSAPLAAVLPTRSEKLLIVGGLDLTIIDEKGNLAPFARLDGTAEEHANEAKCDPAGRVWVGTMTSTLSLGGGGLYRVDTDGSSHQMLAGVTIGNGMGWSPDGSKMYFCDSPTGRIDMFDFDLASGSISGRRTLIQFGLGEGWPDGLAVDEENCLWAAFPIHGEIRRYSASGERLATVTCEASFVTSCAFGGPERRDLLLTTGSIALPPSLVAAAALDPAAVARAASADHAGDLFIARTPVAGLPESAAAL